MGLESIILSKVSQKEKDEYHMISLICKIYLQNGNRLTDIESRLVVAKEKGRWEERTGSLGPAEVNY